VGTYFDFFEYVNVHRVQEFITLVNEGAYQHLSLVGIAEKADFNSKATFYKAFKEIIGQTPESIFKANLRIAISQLIISQFTFFSMRLLIFRHEIPASLLVASSFALVFSMLRVNLLCWTA
jgi:AraC-like DNA-binding protein